MTDKKMTYDIDEMPPIGEALVLAYQHLFAMFGATILVPILVNAQAGEEVLTIPVALVSSGIGTLIYILCTGAKSPVYLGSSFAFIVPVAAAYMKSGLGGAMTGIMAVGLIYVVVSFIIRAVGEKWLEDLLPPVVIGPMIMIIGLGLAPSAVSPFLVGITVGYIVAVVFGLVDFTAVYEASWFAVPQFKIIFRDYTPDFTALITIAPIALVTMCEHIGDHTSLSNIIGRNLIEDPGLHRTMLGDGIATFVAGLIGGPANTTYGENTAVVGMTRVASVKVIRLAAVFAIIVGFFGKFTALVSTIPNAVLGGVSLLLYGFIAVNGLKVLIKNQVNFDESKNIIVASSMLVLALGGAAISIVNGDLSLTISGMSLAAVVGILLNRFLPEESGR